MQTLSAERKKRFKQKKTFSLALSGCAGRAITYIGILEVLQENGIRIDSIAACSSASFVACAFAAEKLQNLKKLYFSLTSREIYNFLEPSFKGGLFNFDKTKDLFEQMLGVENFEDLNIPVTLVASDIIRGESVELSMGNIFRAIKASCSVPGIFEPVVWGDRILVDGGIFSIVPVAAARRFGHDTVMGIDLAASRAVINPYLLSVKRGYNFVARPFKKINSIAGKIKAGMVRERDGGYSINEIKAPRMATVLSKAMDYAILEKKKPEQWDCDLLLDPGVKKYGKIDSGNFKTMYLEGRRAAQEYVSKIKELLG